MSVSTENMSFFFSLFFLSQLYFQSYLPQFVLYLCVCVDYIVLFFVIFTHCSTSGLAGAVSQGNM